MNWMIGLIVLALLLQIGIFLYSRMVKKDLNAKDILSKYNINTRGDLFAAISRNDLPEEDITELQSIYESEGGMVNK